MTSQSDDDHRLRTLYVTQSSRKRRRRTSSKRRRRTIVITVLCIVGLVSVGVVFRDPIGHRVTRLWYKAPPPTMVKDVTAPAQGTPSPKP
jgi:hypothetical protein